MDTKKMIGVFVLIFLVVAFGIMVVQQVASMPDSDILQGASVQVLPNKEQPKAAGLSDMPQDATLPSTSQPVVVDVIVNDIGNEIQGDETTFSSEVAADSSVLEEEVRALNEVSQSYDE